MSPELKQLETVDEIENIDIELSNIFSLGIILLRLKL